MELNVEVERTSRDRIIVRISVPDDFTAEQARSRAEICAADAPDSIEWRTVTPPTYKAVE